MPEVPKVPASRRAQSGLSAPDAEKHKRNGFSRFRPALGPNDAASWTHPPARLRTKEPLAWGRHGEVVVLDALPLVSGSWLDHREARYAPLDFQMCPGTTTGRPEAVRTHKTSSADGALDERRANAWPYRHRHGLKQTGQLGRQTRRLSRALKAWRRLESRYALRSPWPRRSRVSAP
jgi:hypothetical protein